MLIYKFWLDYVHMLAIHLVVLKLGVTFWVHVGSSCTQTTSSHGYSYELKTIYPILPQ
jgi:hypothetical protein